MRIVPIYEPGLGGMRPDIPHYRQALNMSNKAYDAIAQRRTLQERNGWKFLARPSNSVEVDFTSVSRVRYVLADRTTLVMSHHLPTQGFKAWVSGVEIDLKYPINWLAWHQYRDAYRDSAMFCGNDGEAPMLVYSGTTHAGTGNMIPPGDLTWSLIDHQSIALIPKVVDTTKFPPGTYVHVGQKPNPAIAHNPDVYLRALERVDDATNTAISLEGVQNLTVKAPLSDLAGNPFGMTYPNVAIYGAGTITVKTGKATVTGGKFVTGDWGHVIALTDALLYQKTDGSGQWLMAKITGVISNTELAVDSLPATDAPYFIMRRSPFTDACVNGGSPYFTGVKQFPSRVYVGFPNTNLGLPPGWLPNKPFPLSDYPNFVSTDQGAFELYPIDVPDIYGSPNVALLPVGDAVLVCKRRSFHAIYGSYPDFQQRIIDEGAGCIHRGGAVATFSGVWIAGDEALYTWRDGRMFDLSFDKTSTLWHSYTRYFGPNDWVAIGERDNHLFVTITSDDQKRKATFCYDIRRDECISEFTNLHPLHYFSGEQGGDSIECLAVDPEHNGQVIDAGSMVDETSSRAPDGNGKGPSFGYESTFSLAQANGIEGETIFADIAVHARLDSIQPGKDALGVTITSHGGIRREPGKVSTSKLLRPLVSTDPQIVDRHHRRVNQRGRLHTVRIERLDNKRPPGSYCELAQINASVIDAGMDT